MHRGRLTIVSFLTAVQFDEALSTSGISSPQRTFRFDQTDCSVSAPIGQVLSRHLIGVVVAVVVVVVVCCCC